MSYELAWNEKFAIGIKRIGKEEIEKALYYLENKDTEDPDEVVHEVRKKLKKLRALVRLVRDDLGHGFYKKENVCFRDLGRKMSDARDEASIIETLDILKEQFEDQLYENTFKKLRRKLVARKEKLTQPFFKGTALDKIQHVLLAQYEYVDSWPVSEHIDSVFMRSIERVYKRGVKALDKSLKSPKTKNFHEWRKRVKYLRYQISILTPVWPEYMEAMYRETHDLTDYIGLDHDLAIFKSVITQEDLMNSEDRKLLITLVNGHRTTLQTLSLQLGKKVYHEKPKAFCERLFHYWKVYQEEIKKSDKIMESEKVLT